MATRPIAPSRAGQLGSPGPLPRPRTAALGAAQGAQPGRSRAAGSARAGSAEEACKLLVTLIL